jgi:hypothetical protein
MDSELKEKFELKNPSVSYLFGFIQAEKEL